MSFSLVCPNCPACQHAIGEELAFVSKSVLIELRFWHQALSIFSIQLRGIGLVEKCWLSSRKLRTKKYLKTRHLTLEKLVNVFLFIYSCVKITTFPCMAWFLHPIYKHTTHNPSIPSDGGLTFETWTSLFVHGGNLTLMNLLVTEC